MSTAPRRLGKYELEKRLGQGGMAEVWKAFDTQLQRYVAIKMLHANFQNEPGFRERFQREARVIASLHHPNIVQIHDFQISSPSESEEPVAYMVMDYVEGQTLAQYIRSTSRTGKFPPATDIVRLFISIGMAVDYAHQNGMVHRDIKPANILLDKRNVSHNSIGEPILSDFGIAKLMGATTGALSGTWLGTPLYVAPEQVMGHPGNERSDIYSLGTILYEIFTGVTPFQGDTPTNIMMQHLQAMPTPPSLINPAIPPALTVVILRALSKDPAMRFPSAVSLAVAIAEALKVPIPDGLVQPSYPDSVDSMSMPTILVPQQHPGAAFPHSGPWSVVNISSPHPSSPFATPPVASSPVSPPPSIPLSPQQQSSPRLPVFSGGNVAQSSPYPGMAFAAEAPAATGGPPPATALPTPPKQQKRRNLLLIVLAVLVVLGLAASGLGLYLFAFSHGSTPSASTIAGHAFFISSGQVNETSNQGFTDEMQIDLYNVSPPGPGNAYYGWLEGDTNNTMEAPVFLGKLPVMNGQIHRLYPGDSTHTNLLSLMSRFLITEEPDSAIPPTIPSPDRGTWRYFAQFPQPTGSMNTSQEMSSNMMQMGVLDHLRHLLVQAPELQKVGLPGGLDLWLFRNSEKILEWAGSARDDFHTRQIDPMSRQIIRIFDYLDGISPALKRDAPRQPVQIAPLSNAEISLLDLDPAHQFPSLLYLLDIHLNALIQSPNSTAEQRKFATQIDIAIKNVEGWLANVRSYALQLEPHLFQQALLAPANLEILDNMYNTALYAFAGRIDPTTGNVQEGVIQAHYNIQRLATLDVTLFHSH